MARRTARPGRTLAVFFVVLVIVYGLVAAGGKWKPALGLDLQGGTQISMVAKNPGGGSISSDSLNQARDIIDERVNGSGVTSANVITENGDTIVVSIPGANATGLANKVRQTAKLRFRMVACSPADTRCSSATSSTSTGTSSGSTAPRAPLHLDTKAKKAKKTTASSSASSSASASKAPVATNGSSAPASPSASASAPATPANPQADVSVDQAVAFMNNPPASWQQKYASFTCPAAGQPPYQVPLSKDVPGKPLLTCGVQPDGTSDGEPYLLSPAVIEGDGISDAQAVQNTNGAGYVVTLDFKGSANGAFADATGAIAGDDTKQFAIVLDGLVVSAPTADARISGSAQIDGGQNPFTVQEAQSLATNLKYGSLPLEFPASDIQTENIGPSLAGNQLSAGLWAGAVGLLLVMVFCLIYYRGLGLVVISSLIVAGAATYGLVVLLSKTAGVTLDLPGIAGLIVAVGITADSFIVYFERIRDEMREGKSMRVAVDAGWIRARNTCLAADSVSLLASITLYVFASNDVRGFAFMLGLSTVIDLVGFFFFTHPVVKLLSGVRFFNRGHRLSGLSTEAVGGRVKRTATAGGNA